MASKIKVSSNVRPVDNRANDAMQKQRIRELEEEVLALKRRLDELRKAKNTTVTKREREVLEVGAPFGRREQRSPDDKDLENMLSEKDKEWQRQMDDLKKRFAAERDSLRAEAAKDTDCGHWKELEFLRQRNEELENDNSALMSQSRELRDKVDTLLMELSVKEASWCDMEEKFKMEIKHSWGEKYKQWMDQTEEKITDLQRTNALLRTYLKNKGPNGRDPSGQDPDLDLL